MNNPRNWRNIARCWILPCRPNLGLRRGFLFAVFFPFLRRIWYNTQTFSKAKVFAARWHVGRRLFLDIDGRPLSPFPVLGAYHNASGRETTIPDRHLGAGDVTGIRKDVRRTYATAYCSFTRKDR